MAVFVIWVLNTEMKHVPQCWTQWIVLFLLLVSGAAFMVSGQITTTEFEGGKDSGTLLIVNSNLLCQREYECYSLTDIESVRASRRG